MVNDRRFAFQSPHKACAPGPHAAGAVGGNQDMERTKGGRVPKFTL
jgi:hypothetical protein